MWGCKNFSGFVIIFFNIKDGVWENDFFFWCLKFINVINYFSSKVYFFLNVWNCKVKVWKYLIIVKLVLNMIFF